jgi:hypothetical protein
MAVPDYQSFMLPLLKIASHNRKDQVQLVQLSVQQQEQTFIHSNKQQQTENQELKRQEDDYKHPQTSSC